MDRFERIKAGYTAFTPRDHVQENMTDDVRWLIAEVERLRKIEDAARRYVEACEEGAYIGEMQHNLECDLKENPRP